jgi:hypothetical protein
MERLDGVVILRCALLRASKDGPQAPYVASILRGSPKRLAPQDDGGNCGGCGEADGNGGGGRSGRGGSRQAPALRPAIIQ